MTRMINSNNNIMIMISMENMMRISKIMKMGIIKMNNTIRIKAILKTKVVIQAFNISECN